MTDHSANALAWVLSQFKDDNPSLLNINKLLAIFAGRLDILEAIFVNLRDDTQLETAAGVWLDVIGDIVGLSRPKKEQPGASCFACKGVEADIDDPYKACVNAGTGGYLQSLRGLGYLSNPTLEKTDTEYRAMVSAKIQANIADGTIPDVFDYLVTGRGMDDGLTIESVIGRGNITLIDNDYFSQLERYLLDLIGPHSAGTTLHVLNWPLEYLALTNYLTTIASWTIGDDTIDGELSKTITQTNAAGDFAYIPVTDHYAINSDRSSFGSWIFWLKKDNASTFDFMPIAWLPSVYSGASQFGYLFRIDNTETAHFYRVQRGVTTLQFSSNVGATSTSWQKWEITRELSGSYILWSIYMDDVLLTAASGNNPLSDPGVLGANYITIDADQNDEIALCTFDDERLIDFTPTSTADVYNQYPFDHNTNDFTKWQWNVQSAAGKPARSFHVDTSAVSDFCWLPRSFFGVTAAEYAYGTWDYWVKVAGVQDNWMMIAASAAWNNDVTQTGYGLRVDVAGRLELYKITAGAQVLLFQTAAAHVLQQWTNLRLERNSSGVFSIYKDDVLSTPTFGTNPVTDNTHTTSEYIVIEAGKLDMNAMEFYVEPESAWTYTPL